MGLAPELLPLWIGHELAHALRYTAPSSRPAARGQGAARALRLLSRPPPRRELLRRARRRIDGAGGSRRAAAGGRSGIGYPNGVSPRGKKSPPPPSPSSAPRSASSAVPER